MTAPAPKPCPGCGGPAITYPEAEDNDLLGCGSETCEWFGEWIRAEAWNRRPNPETQADHLAEYFQKLRFAPEHHLGGGDIRLTMAQQDEVVAMGRLGRSPPLEPFERLVHELDVIVNGMRATAKQHNMSNEDWVNYCLFMADDIEKISGALKK